jgi:hypothetical protein
LAAPPADQSLGGLSLRREGKVGEEEGEGGKLEEGQEDFDFFGERPDLGVGGREFLGGVEDGIEDTRGPNLV